MENKIIPMQQYGHIEICLREVMERKGLTRAEVARQTNTRFGVINRLYNGTTGRVDLDVLARLCYVLQCETTDILRYVPHSGQE